ncbi:MAG: M20/M25/M40 family metallo-hydrolase [Bacteroidetes bacterium]|nr:MAG: M20/M25/M40 family metallo-hydrolase [Bacteroidota bacterium]
MLSITEQAIELLKLLIQTESFSKQEQATAEIINQFLQGYGVPTHRYLNNVWAINKYAQPGLPTVLLNSHHDTVKPNQAYTRNPFEPTVQDGKLYGLGSNDAGGCLVSLLASFMHLYAAPNLPFNLVVAATAEEEISGPNGVEALLQHPYFWETCLATPAFTNWSAIVGEPTLLNLATAERGLMVVDIAVEGVAGHAARNEGVNSIDKATPILQWLQSQPFTKHSPLLGSTKTTVTGIYTQNTQHNVVPPLCTLMVDVRVNELYSFQEVLQTMQQHIPATVTPRSCRLKSSVIETNHPLVQAGLALGKTEYGSPTTSDKALMPFPALKMGPGDSARSHTADEFIYVTEVEQGIETYLALLQRL